jgi:hypothetical protein
VLAATTAKISVRTVLVQEFEIALSSSRLARRPSISALDGKTHQATSWRAVLPGVRSPGDPLAAGGW